MTLILFTTHAPCMLADELARQGHHVYEALAISEVLALAEQYLDAQIVIAAEIEEKRATEVQRRYPTLHLKPHATVKDVLWELNQDGAVQ